MERARRRIGRWLAAGCLSIVEVAMAASRLMADPANDASAPVAEDMILVEVRLDHALVNEAMPARATAGHLMLPLGELSRELGLAIEVSPDLLGARGFVLRQSRSFALDLVTRRVSIGGTMMSVDSSAVEGHEGDLYVDLRTLTAWLPLDIAEAVHDGVVSFRSREPFPFQQRRERQLNARQTLVWSPDPGVPLPRLVEPYRAISIPFVDQTVTSVVQPGSTRDLLESETHLSGDLLFAQAHVYAINRNDGSNPDVRVNLGRRDSDGGLLGPLHATQVEAGEVLDPGSDLALNAHSARGFIVSSRPLQRVEHFDRETITGELLPDWEVELYRNGLLVGYQQSDSAGSYRFEDVPLDFGFNDFQLVFYGPHGERRSEHRARNVDASMPRPGTWSYRLTGSDPRVGAARAHFTGEVSLSRTIAATNGIAVVDEGDTIRLYSRLGLRAVVGRTFSEVTGVVDESGATAAQVASRVRWGPFGLSARRLQLHEFQSEALPSPRGTLSAQTSVTASLNLRVPGLSAAPLRLEVTPERYEGQRPARRLATAARTSWRGASASHAYSFITDPSGASEQRAHRVDLSVRRSDLMVRSDLEQVRSGLSRLRAAHLNVERRFRDDLTAGLGVGRDNSETRWRVFGGTSRGRIGISIDAQRGERSGTTARLAVNLGLSRDPRDGDWQMQARSVAGSGAASARVFLDQNGNGVRDDGEPPIADAAVLVNGIGGVGRTGRDGTVVMVGLPSDQPTDLVLLSGSLDEPTWIPKQSGVRLVPRAGHTQLVDLPIVVGGEIAGSTRIRRDRATQDAPGITVELVDAKSGKVVQRTRSAFDGFFDLTNVPPGRYELRIAAEHASRYRAQSRMVVIDAKHTIVEGADLILEPRSEAAAQR